MFCIPNIEISKSVKSDKRKCIFHADSIQNTAVIQYNTCIELDW